VQVKERESSQIFPDGFLEKKVVDERDARRRLRVIEELIGSEVSSQLAPRERASLEIEAIWLEFRIGKITSEERQRCLQDKLDIWKKKEPDLFEWLVCQEDNQPNPLSRIRDRIIPPLKKRSSSRRR